MPWRSVGNATPDPYAVWLSEIMLQQTTVAAVKPYFEKFLSRWPTVEDLANAKTDDVMAAWAGLGYYARARNLHKCAQTVAAQHGGRFPRNQDALLALPGIGPYTAAAITAIAFDRRAVVVDGNVERVMSRLHAVQDPLPKSKPALHRLADALTPDMRPGDYAQAVMDLGATICTPKSPACVLCPWTAACLARQQGIAAELPRKIAAKATPTRHGVVFWAVDAKGHVLLYRRPPKGLLGGMLGFPTTEWRGQKWTAAEARQSAPLKARWSVVPGRVEHTFTHFHLELEVWMGRSASKSGALKAAALKSGILKSDAAVWTKAPDLAEIGLPNVMQKVLRHVRAAAAQRRSSKQKPKSQTR